MRTPPAPGLLLTAGALIEQLRECSVPAAELAVPPPTDQLPEHCRRASQLLELPKKLQDWCICRWTGWCSHCQGAAAGMRAVMMSSPLHPALHYGRDEDVEKGTLHLLWLLSTVIPAFWKISGFSVALSMF